MFNRHFGKRWIFVSMMALFIGIRAATAATPDSGTLSAKMQAQLAKMPAAAQQTIMSYSPELRERFFALSPEVRAMLGKLDAGHTRHSKELTLRQVMQEILSELQGIVAAIATDNTEQAADSARRLANHRIPVGGLLPYFALDRINNEYLSVLPAMNDAVEGAALRLAEAAGQGNMGEAAIHVGEIVSGCVACHQVFRGQPGISPLLLPAARK